MSKEQVERIANRHVARCLSKIEAVHKLPEVCADAVRKEMHFCAIDVVEAMQGVCDHEQDDDQIGNR